MYKNIEIEKSLRVSDQERMQLGIRETTFEHAGMHPKVRNIIQSFKKRARSKNWCVSTGHTSRSEYSDSMYQLGSYCPADFGLCATLIEQRYGRTIDPEMQDVIRHEVNQIALSQNTKIKWPTMFTFQLLSWSDYAVAFQHCTDNHIKLPSGVTVADFDRGFQMLSDIHSTLTRNSRQNLRQKIRGISM